MNKFVKLGLLALGGLVTLAPSRRTELDHIGSYNFSVEIDGVNAGFFTAASGLESNIEVIEFQDGDDLTLRKRPGRTSYANVRLTKGFINTDVLQNWWENTRDQGGERRAMSIILRDNAGNEVTRWNLFECFPKSWGTSDFDGNRDAVLTEFVEIVTERIERG